MADEECQICFSQSGERVQLTCCRQFICANCKAKLIKCPFCRFRMVDEETEGVDEDEYATFYDSDETYCSELEN